ncbi:MAG: B12-binding domain-containing radical SAM protein [Candidatus Thorarchaeota archaeon]
MRVLLVVPNSKCDVRESLGVLAPPLGLGYIAGYIRKYGNHEVKIQDSLRERTSKDGFLRVLEAFSPDVVGISGQATPAIYDVYAAARVAKEYNPSTLVVVGGAHVTFEDTHVLNDCPEIDIVVRGEGEATMNELLGARENGRSLADVRGITYRRGSHTIRNPDMPHLQPLDSLPLPAYNLLNLRKYFDRGVSWTSMITSRGCPYQCVFCSSSRIVGKRWRGRSPDNVMKEVRLLENKFGVREIEFLDDLFTFNKNRVKEMCVLFRNIGISSGWTCSTRADIMARDPEMAGWLKAAGCHTVYLGAESGSQRVLNMMNKGIRISDIVKSVRILKENGLNVILSFIIGLPGETREEIKATIDFACRLDPSLAQFTVCTPFPGTPLYEEALENGWLKSGNWTRYSVLDPVMRLPDFQKREIKRYLHIAYLRFYARLRFLWQQVKTGNLRIFRLMAQNLIRYLREGRLSAR